MENQELKFSNTLVKPHSYYRVLCAVVEKMEYLVQLSGIYIYDENGVICKHDYGYFDNDYELEFNGKIVRKIKENFTGTENYIIKNKERDFSWEDTTYILYIHKDNIDLEHKGLEKRLGNIYDVFSINGKTEIRVFVKNLEKEKHRLESLIEDEKGKIKTYDLPLAENDMKSICENLIKYNTMLIQEKERIENYIPTDKDREIKE